MEAGCHPLGDDGIRDATHMDTQSPRPQVPSRLIGTLGPVELERFLAVAPWRRADVWGSDSAAL